jgi:hypothetical protein
VLDRPGHRLKHLRIEGSEVLVEEKGVEVLNQVKGITVL